MGRLFLINLNERQIPPKPLYMCRACQTHIALHECLIHENPEVQIVIFNNVVNVVIDGPAHYGMVESALNHTVLPDMRMANVFCVSCNNLLGSKIVQVGEGSVNTLGMYHMFLNKLQFWNNEQPHQQPHQDA